MLSDDSKYLVFTIRTLFKRQALIKKGILNYKGMLLY